MGLVFQGQSLPEGRIGKAVGEGEALVAVVSLGY